MLLRFSKLEVCKNDLLDHIKTTNKPLLANGLTSIKYSVKLWQSIFLVTLQHTFKTVKEQHS